jgi:hypothetical protein
MTHLSTSVIAAGERSKALLAGCIPDGQLQSLLVHVHEFHAEIHANGGRQVFEPARALVLMKQ